MDTYLVYFDETGDDGVTTESSKFFLLTSIYMSSENWQSNYNKVKACRNQLNKTYGFHASEEMHTNLNKAVFLSEDFKALWNKIKYKTTYNVNFDSEKLIEECKLAFMRELNVSSPKLIYTKAKANITVGGVDTTETDRQGVLAQHNLTEILDIITYLQNETNLTRKTIVRILTESKTLDAFKKNPQKYMEEATRIISLKMRKTIIDGIKYTKIGEESYYAQELFESEELQGYLNQNMIPSTKSVYEYAVFGSQNEERFANQFENNQSVKCYAKLPGWFKISTPLGSYNPDWAVLIEKDCEQKLYFVLETKGNIQTEMLRPAESGKIACGHKHFAEIGTDITFDEIDDYNEFIENI